MSTESGSQTLQTPASIPASAPAAGTTQTSTEWTPFVGDPAKSAQDNLIAKDLYDKGVPAGHDPNVPLAAKAAEPVKAEPAPAPAPVAPTALTFESLVAPEGFELDVGLGAELVTLINAKAANPAELAAGLIDLQVKAAALAQETDSKQWDEVQTGWKKAVEADPEIGGEKYAETTATTTKLSDRFGGPKFQEALTLTGMGNHPEFHRFMSKIAPMITEAAPVSPGGAPAQKGDYSSSNLYPDQDKK